ncbi:MAG TPA: hypothetical protein VFD59_10015, partial [Nocardioidaceae bacterium]|nr:hypothetical protein [Nocardioidaceae bacterium]
MSDEHPNELLDARRSFRDARWPSLLDARLRDIVRTSAALPLRRGPRVSVLVVGISHKTAPLPVLERVALDAEGVQKLIREISDSEHVTETTVLSTCN